ncbi:MAG: LPS export ABC transporter periplasmic protein LptC [Firmicutes bacterium]|nr:LPS export ABC transporter periplasmic protein LptC [Bacillota bacterium]
MFKIDLGLKNKWLLLIILMLVGVIAYFSLTFFFHTISREQDVLVGEGKLNVNSDEFIGLTLKIPGAEKNGYWELNVARLESKDEIGEMKEINGDYFLDKKPIYHISAESGIIQWKTRVLQMEGQVNLKTNDGKSLRADEISWDPNIRKILAVNKVVLESPGLTVTTEKLDGDLSLEQVKFSGITKSFYRR